MNSYTHVFQSLRKGTILKDIESFNENQLRPFLPYLMHICFGKINSSATELDLIRSKLIGIDVCNQVYEYFNLDYILIETKCCVEFAGKAVEDIKEFMMDPDCSHYTKKPYISMSPIERVLYICAHLIWTKETITREQIGFIPFDICRDQANLQEECGWILSLLSLNCPELFPVNELTKQLLNYEFAPSFILSLVMNHCDLFDTILDQLVLLLKQPDDDSYVVGQARATVFKLFQLDFRQAERFTRIIMENDRCSKRTLQMICSSDSIDDRFFVDILTVQLSNRANSDFVAFIIKSANKPLMRAICQSLGAIMERCRRSNDSELQGRIVLLISLLASSVNLRLSTDESRQWLIFLTTERITDGVLLKTVLATILASPSILPDQISFRDEQIGHILIGFFSRLHLLIQKPEYNQLSNVMILIYVHLITDNAEDLANLLSSILGQKVPKTLNKQQFVRELYIGNAINEHDMVQKAANISVTNELNATISGYLPVHCICAMLHWRSFSKYSTPIQEWVKAQLLECRTPVHPIVPHLLENFIQSCIPTESFPHFNQPIDERFFQEIFSGDIFDESRLVFRILSLTYLIAFNYKLDISSLPKEYLGTNKAPKSYSQRLWDAIPIRYLLIMADNRHDDFQHIRLMLQKYMVLSMPHLQPEQYHFDVFKRSTHIRRGRHDPLVDPDALSSALNNAILGKRFNHFTSLLDNLLDQPIQQQFRHYDTILQAMASSLDVGWPCSLLNKITQLWARFDSIVPRRLHEDTIRLWLNSDEAAKVSQLRIRDNNFLISHTPLVLFRADQRVFRSPPHLRCFCRLLSFYLAASRDANFQKLSKAAANSSKTEMTEKEDLLRSFIGTQRLAVVQVFIELCDGNSNEIPNLEEIRQILCAQIHQFFIVDTHLPKLVHFNMYPMHLIPVIVRGVPSAHVLINSIGELLSGGSLKRRIFAILLLTELLKHYKIPTAFGAITLVSDLLDTICCNIINEEFIVLMLNITPSLASLIRLSPFHAEHLLATLERSRQLAKNRLALYTSFTEARSSPEQQLLQLVSHTLEDLPKLPE